MCSVSAKVRMAALKAVPICSNSAGDEIGMPRTWCRKKTTPPDVCSPCTKPDRYRRSRHWISSTACPSSASFTVTTRGLVDRDILTTSGTEVYCHESAVTATDALHGDHRLAVRGGASLGGWCFSQGLASVSVLCQGDRC